jgi:hypothetical protein
VTPGHTPLPAALRTQIVEALARLLVVDRERRQAATETGPERDYEREAPA